MVRLKLFLIYVWAIPAWSVISGCIPILPLSHPLKGTEFTLKDWAVCRPKIIKLFDSVVWVSIIALIALV